MGNNNPPQLVKPVELKQELALNVMQAKSKVLILLAMIMVIGSSLLLQHVKKMV
jgi:hypothetical protein